MFTGPTTGSGIAQTSPVEAGGVSLLPRPQAARVHCCPRSCGGSCGYRGTAYISPLRCCLPAVPGCMSVLLGGKGAGWRGRAQDSQKTTKLHVTKLCSLCFSFQQLFMSLTAHGTTKWWGFLCLPVRPLTHDQTGLPLCEGRSGWGSWWSLSSGACSGQVCRS